MVLLLEDHLLIAKRKYKIRKTEMKDASGSGEKKKD